MTEYRNGRIVDPSDLDLALEAACDHIVVALREAGIPAEFEDGHVAVYGVDGWELRLWPFPVEDDCDPFGPIVVDFILDRKLDPDPDEHDGKRQYFDPLKAEDLGELRANCAEDFIVIVAATRAILAGLPGGVA